jgi:hypothetical protein
MAIPAQTPTWLGYGSGWTGANTLGAGVVATQGGLSGMAGKTLTGIVTFVLDGTLTAATMNMIDGVQNINQQTIVCPMQSVTAPATYNGTANVAIYSGVGNIGQIQVGQSFVVTGFANGGNNGTFTVLAKTAYQIYAVNASSVAETNPAAILTWQYGAQVAAVRVTRSAVSAAGVADTAAAATYAQSTSAISNKSAVINFSAAGTNLQTISFLVDVLFAS